MIAASKSIAASHHVRANLLRKISDSTDLSKTMRKAVRVLAEAGIPSLVVDGYAVQENGYPRFTSDIDLIVPDVALAREAFVSVFVPVGSRFLEEQKTAADAYPKWVPVDKTVVSILIASFVAMGPTLYLLHDPSNPCTSALSLL